MAVYESNIRSLAEFISETKLGFEPREVISTKGYRINNGGSRYEISAHKINCNRIYVVNDCFIDIDGNIIVISYVPSVEYTLVSNELSPCYRRGEHLCFKYKADSQVLKYEIGNDVNLNSYNDFHNSIENLIKFIGKNIEASINEFNGDSWRISGVKCNILWQTDKVKCK